MQPLPIDSLLPEIVASLRQTTSLVIEAPPGAGKTTRVPSALLDAGLAGEREVWVLEPRRLAARMAARRVAEERGEQAGETIGYQVRFDEVSGPRTRLRFLTEGVFTRRLLSDPQLSRVGLIVLDEFHERHLQADMALALARHLQQSTRPELRIVAMSATLDAAPVSRFLGDCPSLRSEGRRFEVALEHLARADDERPLAAQVEAAVRRLAADGLDGDVLVFLPGAAEIRRAQEACAAFATQKGLLVLPLHGDLPAAEQDKVIGATDKRKIILSTNVAETSITIDGVAAVVDSGLARIAGHSPWSGLPTLDVARISRASAEQRAGRAGRTRPGRCLRLYTAQDFAARPAHESPEVRRLDLAEPALELHAAGVRDLRRFGWFEAPPAPALDAADALLRRLGAIDGSGALTETGTRMLRLPLHPRLSRLVVEAVSRGVASEGCIIAALIGERDIRAGRTSLEPGARGSSSSNSLSGASASGPSDLLAFLDLFVEAEQANFAPERLRRMSLDPAAVRTVERVRRQLQRICESGRKPRAHEEQTKVETAGRKTKEKERAQEKNLRATPAAPASSARDTELLISILTGYPDRVARRRTMTNEAKTEAGAELLLAGGGAGVLAPASVVRQSEFLVAVDAGQHQRRDARRVGAGGRSGAGTLVRLASAIETDWLLDLFVDAIRETREVVWNAQSERVETLSRLLYDELVLDESRRSDDASDEETTQALVAAALACGPEAFVERETFERFLARVEFVARTFPESDFPTLGEREVRESLARMCEGRRSFAQLREAARAGELLEGLRRNLDAEQSRLLAAMAPERVTLASGRAARVNYESTKPPWLASRLQDFFRMREGPRVAGGRVALVLHLLAPSGRPVQVTADLEGFWQRHYPQVRRELGRRYPRHAWPENPLKPPAASN